MGNILGAIISTISQSRSKDQLKYFDTLLKGMCQENIEKERNCNKNKRQNSKLSNEK